MLKRRLTKEEKQLLRKLEEIYLQANDALEAGEVYGRGFVPATRQEYWKGYRKAVVDICQELFGKNLTELTFDEKLRIARRLGTNLGMPMDEVGFFHNNIHHSVGEINAVEGLSRLFEGAPLMASAHKTHRLGRSR